MNGSTELSVKVPCPACGGYGALSFFDGGMQPLATLGWPESEQEALDMIRLPLTFVSCATCGHIYNEDFNYDEVPYSNNPNRMYNDSTAWVEHLETMMSRLADGLSPGSTVLEIGCGAGLFLHGIAEKVGEGRFVGFDPNGGIDADMSLIEFRKDLFDPNVHMQELRPDLIVCRHVVEHVIDPLRLFEPIARWAELDGKPIDIFIEVPCVDAVLNSQRTADFFYEHVSNFTSVSFKRFLQHIGGTPEYVEHGYGGEVIYGLVHVTGTGEEPGHEALRFSNTVNTAKESVLTQLNELVDSGRSVAIWGGSGKAAAFLNFHDMDKSRFPTVIDSDKNKADFYVPGTGQKIQYRDYLLDNPAQVIVIPMQWRARDIVSEIKNAGIQCEAILIEHNGQLVEFDSDDHPY